MTGRNRCTSISINEDSIVEYNETFNVILTENSDKLLIQSGRNNTQITIIEDNDCKSIVCVHNDCKSVLVHHWKV